MRLEGRTFYWTILAFIGIANLAVFIPATPPLLRILILGLFLLFVPGTLILMAMGIDAIRGSERLLYTVGLSVSFIMFGSLFANWLLPFVGIAAPLHQYPLLLWFDALLGIIAFALYLRKDERARFGIDTPTLDTFNQDMAVIPIAIFVLAIIGTLLVNNGQTNAVSIVCAILAALYIIAAMLLQKKLHQSIYPWAALCIAFAVLLMGWLRSSYVSGVDINIEYFLFTNVQSAGLWSLEIFRDTYNACLSITLLPAVIGTLTGLPSVLVFKIAIPLLFSFSILAVYVFLTRYVSPPAAFLGACFVIAQQAFLLWWTIPVKQQIGLLFFSLLMVALTTRSMPHAHRAILLAIFGTTMVVSHYTTTYITITIFIVTLAGVFAYRQLLKYERTSKVLERLRLTQNATRKRPKRMELDGLRVPLLLVIFLILTTYIWYFQITQTQGSSVNSFRQIIDNSEDLFDEGTRQAGLLGSIFNPFHEEKPQTKLLEDYSQEITKTIAQNPNRVRYEPQTYSSFRFVLVPDAVTKPIIAKPLTRVAYLGNEMAKLALKLLLVLGTAIVVFVYFQRNDIELEVMLLTLCCFGILAAIIFLPFASIVYSVSRTYQQIVVVLALPLVIAVEQCIQWAAARFSQEKSLFSRLRATLRIGGKLSAVDYSTLVVTTLVACIIATPFLFYIGAIPQLMGGGEPMPLLSNNGRIYDEVYTHRGDILAGEWLFTNTKQNTIYATARAREKLWLVPKHEYRRVATGVAPQLLNPEGYVFSDYTNTNKNKGFIATAGTTVSYEYPTAFLVSQKNLIYSNGDAVIYR